MGGVLTTANKIDGTTAWLGQVKRSYKMNNTQSTYHALSRAEIAEGATRALQGELDNNHMRSRVVPRSEVLTHLEPENLQKMSLDYYNRKFIEQEAGVFIPTRMTSWKRVVEHYDLFLRHRLPANYAKFKANTPGSIGVGIIPFIYKCPHPSASQNDAWMKRWNNGGDLSALVERLAPGCLGFPVIIHTDAPTSSVQMTVVLCFADDREPVPSDMD